ncbi:MAG TPA: hypothetical protein IAC01_00790 [Candidatus Limicola stercorigallinarum]|nr:hypothetical protein [Candidatus Limicola stercorigallinarum]
MMRHLVHMELEKAFCSRWFAVALGAACAVAVASAMDSIMYYFATFSNLAQGDAEYWIGMSPLSSYAASIVVGSLSRGPWRELYRYLVPLLMFVPFVWTLRSELNSGYINQVLTRSRRSSYLWAKGFAVFTSAFMVIAVSLLLNFVILSCALPGYQLTSADVLYLGVTVSDMWAGLFYTRPVAYILLNALYTSVCLASVAVLVLAVSSLVKSPAILTIGSYIALLFVKYVNDNIVFVLAGNIRGFVFDPIDFLLVQGSSFYTRDALVMAVVAVGCLLVSLFIFMLTRRRDVLCDSSDV